LAYIIGVKHWRETLWGSSLFLFFW